MFKRHKNDFQSFSLLYWLTAPMRFIGRGLARFSQDDRIRGEESVASRFGILLSPIKLLVALASFLVLSWTVTRRGWPFVFGLPAFLGACGMLMVLWLHHYRYPRLIDRWQAYYENFLVDEDRGPEIAQHFAAKRVVFEPDNDEAKYQLAAVWEQTGKSERAEDLMLHLASRDLPRAHLWFARKNLAAEPGVELQEWEPKVKKHIDAALAIEPENPSARAMLSNFYLMKAMMVPKEGAQYLELVEKAAEELEFVNRSGSAEAFWQLPNLVRSLMELQKENEAKRAFNQARQSMEVFMRRSPDNRLAPTIWTTLVRSAVQLKDFSLARSLVQQATRQGAPFGWGQEMAALELQVVVAEALSLDEEKDLSKKLDLLAAYMVENPTNQVVSDRLLREISPIDQDLELVDLLNRLERSKLFVSHPEVIHLLMGIGLASQGEIETARTNWRIGSTRSAETGEKILRTFLSTLVTKYREEFENVQDMIALAMELYPDQPRFYEVRGIYFKNTRRIQEAIADFKHAAEVIPAPGNFTLHVQLIECYQELNETELANEHRRTLQKIINSANPGDRRFMEMVVKRLDETTG